MNELTESLNFSKSLQATATATAREVKSAPAPVEDAIDPERLKKIELLKQRYEDGTYQTDITELSKRIVDEHRID